MKNPLEFEKPLFELEEQLEALRNRMTGGDEESRSEFAKVEQKVSKMRKEIYGKLTPYQRVQLSRHFDRPFMLDYVERLCENFVEFHGDRLSREDPAIVGGTARFQGTPIMVVGHQRGRTTSERVRRNFGMPQPEGYRKAMRLMRLAEKFKLPLITFIDTQGAFPGIEAEERGQAEAIARNLAVLADLETPIISIVIGEGGSGGALALGVCDRLLMLENASYSVITPEGCASILWHRSRDEPPKEQAATAAEILKLTAGDLRELGVVDTVIPEPLGGAHANYAETTELVGAELARHLKELRRMEVDQLKSTRYERYRRLGPVSGEGG